MREILFRGKRIDTGEWIDGYYVKQSNHACFASGLKYQHFIYKDVFIDFNLGGIQEFDVIPETVGQYTGLTDKNGKKVFEGDIIKTKYGRLCIVVWFSSPTYVGWDLKVVEIVDNCLHTRKPDFSDLYYSDNLEIVGNIHDNPELLEVEL